MNSPICTVILLTYNHVKWFKKCIESVLNQKTNYNYIIHVFDDASTDGTSDLVREYANKYPDKVIPFIAQKNQGAQTNVWNAWNSVKTKYCILTETDDYWCNENKLQMQIDAMEKHPECSFCSTNNYYEVIKDDYLTFLDKTIQIKPDIYKDKKIISYQDIKNIKAGFLTHLSSRLIRASAMELGVIQHKEAFLFDASQYFYLLNKGPMYWIDKPTSVYVKTGEGVWSSVTASNRMNQFWRAMLELNLQTNGAFFEKIAQQIVLVTNYWLNLELKQNQQTQNNPQSDQRNPIKTIKKNLKKLKHYIFPPIVLDLFNLPRNIIRKIKGKKK